MGAPTKYSDEILVLARAYVEEFQPSDDELIPMVCGLALHLNLSRETIYAWSRDEDKQDFSDIVNVLMAKQEKMLFSGGLSGDFNASITKLALTKHNYSDKTDNSTTLDLSKLTMEQLTALANGSSA